MSSLKSTGALPGFKSKCEKILKTISSSNVSTVKYLMEPVDLVSFSDYLKSISHPMDLGTVRKKLSTNPASGLKLYEHHNEFALDMRRVFGNFFRYNSHPDSKSMRDDIAQLIVKFEKLWKELQDESDSNSKSELYYFQPPLEPISACIAAIEELYKTEGCINFMFPAESYLDKNSLKKYLTIVKKPINLGSIISNIIEAQYSSIQQLEADLELMAQNCSNYWQKLNDGAEYIQQAYNLKNAFMMCYTKLVTGVASSSTVSSSSSSSLNAPTSTVSSNNTNNNNSSKRKASASAPEIKVEHDDAALAPPTTKKKKSALTASSSSSSTSTSVKVEPEKSAVIFAGFTPPYFMQQRLNIPLPSQGSVDQRIDLYFREMFRKCLDETRKHFIRPTANTLKVMTAAPFFKAVNPIEYPDYATIVTSPMDFAKMEKKISGGRYTSVVLALNDMKLIRDNTHLYNEGIQGLEVRIMSDQTQNYFRFCVKTALHQLYQELGSNDVAWKHIVTPELLEEGLLTETVPDDVTKFIQLMLEEDRKLAEIKPPMAKTVNPKSTKAAIASPTVKLKIPQNSSSTASYGAAQEYYVPESPIILSEKKPVASKSAKKTVKSTIVQDNSQLYAPMDYGTVDPVTGMVIYPEPVEARIRPEWELAAESVLRVLSKHAYIDRTKTTAIADFYSPPTGRLDDASESLNLQDLGDNLLHGDIPSAAVFYEKVCGIFQRVVDFFEPHKAENYAIKLIRKCSHLVQYAKWVCLEYLPVSSEAEVQAMSSSSSKVSPLNEIVQLNERALREQLLDNIVPRETSPPRDSTTACCLRLLKDVEKTRNRQEQYNLGYFMKPVNERVLSDYSMYVKKPMDLGTIRSKLESGGVGFARYLTCSQFVADLKRVFSNAIKYNSAHKEGDVTGLSKLIYEAAITLQSRVESLVPMFTVDLIDRFERTNILQEDEGVKERETALRIEATRQSIREFEQEQLEKLKATDKAYALDLDSHAKKLKTRRELQASALKLWQRRLRQEKADAEASPAHDAYEDMDDDEDGGPRNSIAGYQESSEFGEDGKYFEGSIQYLVVPQKFFSQLRRKQAVRERAWRNFLKTANKSLVSVAELPVVEETAALKLSIVNKPQEIDSQTIWQAGELAPSAMEVTTEPSAVNHHAHDENDTAAANRSPIHMKFKPLKKTIIRNFPSFL